MRCFVGIPLPETTRAALVSACDAVRAADPHWRGEKWVAAQNLHITLVFLGDIPAEAIARLSEAISDGLTDVRAFELPFAGLRPVPNERRARMLWADYDDPSGTCAAIASTIGAAAGGLDIAVEDRAFKAHVTLARARRPRHLGETVLSTLSTAQLGVPEFVSVPSARLFSSTLTKTGPRYETLETWDFPA